MSFPTIPAVLSAFLFAGTAGAAATNTTINPDRTEDGRKARRGDAERGKAKAGKNKADKAGKAKRGGLCAAVQCTDEQKAELKEIREGTKADRKDDRAKVKELNAALATEFRKDKPSQATLQRVFSQMETMRAAHAKERLESLGKIHAVLTPAQREMLADRIEKRGMRATASKSHRKQGKRKGEAKGEAKGKLEGEAKGKREGKAKGGAKGKRGKSKPAAQ